MLTTLFTFLGSSTIGALLQHIRQSAADKHEEQMALIKSRQAATELQAKEMESARKVDSDSWVKRAMAIVVVFSVVLLPKLAMLFRPDLLIAVGYYDITSFFSSTTEQIKWLTLNKGFAITPFDLMYCEAVLGMYFGRSLVKRG